jgi:hypothetical protein
MAKQAVPSLLMAASLSFPHRLLIKYLLLIGILPIGGKY